MIELNVIPNANNDSVKIDPGDGDSFSGQSLDRFMKFI